MEESPTLLLRELQRAATSIEALLHAQQPDGGLVRTEVQVVGALPGACAVRVVLWVGHDMEYRDAAGCERREGGYCVWGDLTPLQAVGYRQWLADGHFGMPQEYRTRMAYPNAQRAPFVPAGVIGKNHGV